MSTNNLDPLGIDYAVTEDDFDGAPVVPGFTGDGDFWACVARLSGGKTRWRRIYLQHTQHGSAAGRPGRTMILSRRHDEI